MQYCSNLKNYLKREIDKEQEFMISKHKINHKFLFLDKLFQPQTNRVNRILII